MYKKKTRGSGLKRMRKKEEKNQKTPPPPPNRLYHNSYWTKSRRVSKMFVNYFYRYDTINRSGKSGTP